MVERDGFSSNVDGLDIDDDMPNLTTIRPLDNDFLAHNHIS